MTWPKREPSQREIEHVRWSLKIISEALENWLDPTGEDWTPVTAHLSYAGVKLLAVRGLLSVEEPKIFDDTQKELPWQ